MPNAIQRAFGWLAESLDLTSAPRDPMDPRLWGGVSSLALAGVNVTPDSAAQLDVVQACLGRLGGTISTLPLMVFERLADGKRRMAREHPLYKILHQRPNATMAPQEFFEEQERHLAWHRNAYARIVPDPDTGHPIGSLEPINPKRVLDVRRGDDGFVYYYIQRLAPASGIETVRQDEIFHVRRAPLTDDGLRGKPVYQTATETLGRALAVEQFGALYFKNGGSGGGFFLHPGNFKSKEDEQDFIKSLRESSTGLNRHKDRLLKYGVTYTSNKVENDEAQFIETRGSMAYSVCRLWSMPPHMAGILDKATFTNIEQQSTEFVVYTIAPDVCAWEQACGRDLLVGPDQDRYFVEMNVAGLLRGDFKTRWQGYAWGRQWGWLSVNDVLRLENMDEIGPQGDQYLVPLNMSPAGAAGAADAEAPKPGVDENPQDPEAAEEQTDAP